MASRSRESQSRSKTRQSVDATPLPGKRRRHEELLDRAATEAKASKWIESARTAGEALRLAHAARDFERVGEAAERAREARKRVRQAATKGKGLTVVQTLSDLGISVTEEGVAESGPLKGGCYLLEPPGCVGVDGRTLRDLCERAGKATLVVVREPPTRAGLWPVVAVGPVTIRARIDPPKGKDGPTPDWCAGAIDAIGQAALEASDGATAAERVEALVEHADAAPECEAVYEAIIEASAVAAREAAAAAATKAANAGRKKAPAPPRDDDDDNE